MTITTKKFNWCKVMFFSTMVIFFVTLGAQVFLTNKLALKSHELLQLSQQKEALQKTNADLEFQDASLSSLSYINEQATKLGFVEMHDSVIAIRPVTVASAITQ